MRTILICLLLAITFGFVFNSCNKDTLNLHKEDVLSNAQRQELWNKFRPNAYTNVLANSTEIKFRTDESPYPSLKLLLQLADKLQLADSTDAFLENMVRAFGLPLWDYSIMKGSESSDYVVSVPFDRITSDTSISGILKFYKNDDGEEFVFVPRTELDSLTNTTIDTAAFDGYISGIFHDFLIFEFNLFENLNLPYFDFLREGSNIQTDQVLPRSQFICTYRYETEYDIVYLFLPGDSGPTLVSNLFMSLMGGILVATIHGAGSVTYVYLDCYYVGVNSHYDGTGWNWSTWSIEFLNHLNSLLAGGGNGNGGGGSNNPPPPPPPTPLELCMADNMALSVANNNARATLVNACDLDGDIDALVDNAIEAACDIVPNSGERPNAFRRRQLREFNATLANQNLINPSILNQITINGNPIPLEDLEDICDEENENDPECPTCSVGQKEELFYADNRAKAKLRCAVELLSSFDGSEPVNVKLALKDYFTNDSEGLAMFLANIFTIIGKKSEGAGYEVQLNGEGECDFGVAAWTYPVIHFTDIKLCDPTFFNQTLNDQSVTLIHEWMHLYFFAGDVAYNWEPEFQNLSYYESIFNADSWSAFVNEICP